MAAKAPPAAKPAAPAAGGKPEIKKAGPDSAGLAKHRPGTDTLAANRANNAPFSSAFVYKPEKTMQVALLLTRVDPVYATEARNAFGRYNRENYYNKTLDITNIALNDSSKLMLINGFDSTAEAMDYLDKAQKLAPREIIPWMPSGKFVFLIISDANLERLKTNRDLPGYRRYLSYYYPGKF